MIDQVAMRQKKTGEVKLVDINYACLHVVARGKTASLAADVRARLQAGEQFSTAEHDFYARPAAARVA